MRVASIAPHPLTITGVIGVLVLISALDGGADRWTFWLVAAIAAGFSISGSV